MRDISLTYFLLYLPSKILSLSPYLKAPFKERLVWKWKSNSKLTLKKKTTNLWKNTPKINSSSSDKNMIHKIWMNWKLCSFIEILKCGAQFHALSTNEIINSTLCCIWLQWTNKSQTFQTENMPVVFCASQFNINIYNFCVKSKSQHTHTRAHTHKSMI